MLSVAIQAGGESRRMGTDKGLISFLGEPLIQRVIRRVAHIADEILVTTNHPEDYSFLGLPLFPDIIPNRGALGGLYTALSAATSPLVAVIACDMPFINATLLAAQKEKAKQPQADIVIPKTEHGLEPFHTIYQRATCLPHIKAALEAGRWRVDSWFGKVHMKIFPLDEIRKHDPQLLSFLNINTPKELVYAEELARQFQV